MNIWLENGLATVNYDHGNQTAPCHNKMAIMQIVQLINQQPCAQIIQKENYWIMKCNTNVGNMIYMPYRIPLMTSVQWSII